MQEVKECSDHAKVWLRRDWVVETRHLNSCPVRVDGLRGKGVYLFKIMISTNDQDCFLTAQIVCVSRLFDLNVEHRGAGPALELPYG